MNERCKRIDIRYKYNLQSIGEVYIFRFSIVISYQLEINLYNKALRSSRPFTFQVYSIICNKWRIDGSHKPFVGI